MKAGILILALLLGGFLVNAQKRLLDNPSILKEINLGMGYMYNYKFDQARKSVDKLKAYSPDHPALPFMRGLIVYWENYPLNLEHPESEKFISYMEECIIQSEKMLKKNPDELEAIFFDLFGRAFYVMFYSDNGKPGKVFPHLNSLYRETMKGFHLKDDFVEFYFSTGLYNYYVVAYPEKHPSYKAITVLFQGGDKELGLKQLEFAAENALFLKAESNFFLSLLYLNYEHNLSKASEYAARLYREYPDNPFYTGNYLELLLLNKKYFLVPVLIDKLQASANPFAQMQASLYKGYYYEKYERKFAAAKMEYEKALKSCNQYGYIANHYKAFALMGQGRIYKKEGDIQKANASFREARGISSYEYIINDK